MVEESLYVVVDDSLSVRLLPVPLSSSKFLTSSVIDLAFLSTIASFFPDLIWSPSLVFFPTQFGAKTCGPDLS